MNRGRRTARAHLLCGAAISAVISMSGVAFAQDAEPISIPSQSLATALNSFGVQTGRAVMFKPELAAGKQSRAVDAAADPELALNELLSGTGLSWRRQGDLFMIVESTDPQSGSAAGDGAEGTVDTLIVTAQKREEDIQDVPIAISAFTQEDLTRSQVAGGPDLMTQVPNMTFTKTNFTSYSIQLRGIGTQAISATTDPAVAVALNNTPFITNRFFEQEFYDLARVEVLRGPQGTLYGRNATAGVVNVISAKPKFVYEARLAADVANYSSTRLEGMINIPFGETAALRLAGAWTKRDGFVTNIVTGDQTDGRDLWSGRVSFAIEPTDSLRADLIYERFEENDDRLRSGKQLCKKDPGPSMIGSTPVPPGAYPLNINQTYLSQGCLSASLYSPEAFQTPNGFALPYYGPAGAIGSPVRPEVDPYASATQSRDLREIETHIKPEYAASADLVELQLRFDLTDALTLASETGFALDRTFSYQDFNRFDTAPGVFTTDPQDEQIEPDGTFCDPQIGCTNRLALADLATGQSQQFSQEFRISSNFEGPFNFNIGANFLRYETEIKYYVFLNSISAFEANAPADVDPWNPGVSDNGGCFESDPNNLSRDYNGYAWSNPNVLYETRCSYIDPNNIHNLNDQGRNYFLSKNPYNLLSYAAFGELYYQIADSLKVTAGFRWTVDQKTAPQHPSWLIAGLSYGTPVREVIQQEWREPTGRVAIDWKPDLAFTDDTLLYASYVRGYKAGGANPPSFVIVVPPVAGLVGGYEAYLDSSITHPATFAPEFVDAFEVGSKNTLLDGRATLNLGGFYYDYTGYQISQIVNRSAVNLNFDAEVWGLELEADWRPVENFRLGLKVGYEKTRLADGSEAVDLMDRTAGMEGWELMKPFPPQPSNCVVPSWLLAMSLGSSNATRLCAAYLLNVDPYTNLPYVADPQVRLNQGGDIVPIDSSPVGGISLSGYPGYDPASAPNNGEGFAKDVGGNKLPNAPDYTATLTADYTLPLANNWLMTLHSDLYYQSEAWTRIFNTEGYDKLKAYTNVNVAAIFTNEEAGWNVMAYVKNVFDRNSITGAFLNSDDTGLTTNVFLTEPRLYGLRITKAWNGGAPLGGWFAGDPDGHLPFRLEVGGHYGPFSQDHQPFAPPTTDLFTPDFPFPFGVQEDLDWGAAGGAKLTWQPRPQGWFVSGGVRYGRALGSAEAHPKQEVPGGLAFGEQSFQLLADAFGVTPEYVAEYLGNYSIDPTAEGLYRYATTTASNEENFAVVDFLVGKDVGLGGLGTSTLSGGLRYAHLESVSSVLLHGRPDLTFPAEEVFKYGGSMHRVHGDLDTSREFDGAGLALRADAARPLLGSPDEAGQVSLEFGFGGSLLWGKQKMKAQGEVRGDYVGGLESTSNVLGIPWGPTRYYIEAPYVTPIDVSRSKSVTVPSLEVSLGLSYELGRTKVSGGYRWERYFDAIDGGIEEHKDYDRDFHGPYFKLSVGFGGG